MFEQNLGNTGEYEISLADGDEESQGSTGINDNSQMNEYRMSPDKVVKSNSTR